MIPRFLEKILSISKNIPMASNLLDRTARKARAKRNLSFLNVRMGRLASERRIVNIRGNTNIQHVRFSFYIFFFICSRAIVGVCAGVTSGARNSPTQGLSSPKAGLNEGDAIFDLQIMTFFRGSLSPDPPSLAPLLGNLAPVLWNSWRHSCTNSDNSSRADKEKDVERKSYMLYVCIPSDVYDPSF